MKKLFLLALSLFITVALYAQKTDHSKLNKEQLIKLVEDKDKEIITLKAQVAENAEHAEKTKKDLSQNSSATGKEVTELKATITATNAAFLRKLFDDEYTNTPYFKVTDLEKPENDNTAKIKNRNALAKSIKVGETNSDVLETCAKVLDFNENYLALFRIRKEVLNEKYNAEEVTKAIKEIEGLPALETDSKLDITKKRMLNFLKNYPENTCTLKRTLEAYRKGDQSPAMQKKYTELEKNDLYKDYPYLVKIIQKVKKNRNDYSADDLQPCDVEAKDIERPTQDTKP
jgi:hypothetical protein